MEDLARKAVSIAQKHGCTYCDARVETTEKFGLLVENGLQEHVITRHASGIGIRMLYDGAWGFYSTSDFQNLEEGVAKAIKAAKHRSQKRKNKIELAPVPTVEQTVRYAARKKPDFESLSQIAFDCDDAMRVSDKITKSTVFALNTTTSKYFANSEGSNILQEFADITVDLVATASQHGRTQSINRTEGGRGGLEKITEDVNILHIAERVSEKAVQILDAGTVKEDTATIVMNPDFVALLTHEILGHPSEADRVLGKEMAWAGGAWWAGKIGQQIGSSDLNVVDDPTISGSLGWYEFDDEGTTAQRKQLLKDGILVNHMHSRETAHIFGVEPNSSMRATSYRFMPLIRMACTCIDKGSWSQDEMIKDVKHGYLVSDMKVPSIDMKRHNWSISCQYANRIENGQIKELLRDVIVVGTAPEFFKSIDACGKDFTVRPITNCGKGDPMQQMAMGNGGPSIRGVATVKSAGI